MVQPRVILVENTECHDGRILDLSSLHACDEPRLYRERAPVTNASSGDTDCGAEGNHAADFGEPETSYYVDRDP